MLSKFCKIILLAFLLTGPISMRVTELGRAQASTGGVSISVKAGFDSYCKSSRWIPVHVILENTGPDVEGSVQAQLDGSTGGGTIYAYSVSLPNTSRKELTFYAYPENYLSGLEVRFQSGNKVLTKAQANLSCINGGDLLFGVLSGSSTAYNRLADLNPQGGTVAIARLEVKDLPAYIQGYSALDALFVSDIDTGQLSPDQRNALAGWVADGGKLIVFGGPNWQRTAAGLGDLLPLTPTGDQTITGLSDLQSFVEKAGRLPSSGSSTTITMTTPLEGSLVAASGDLISSAQVLARGSTGQADIPLVIRRQMDAGKVTYLAVDPSNPPLKNWDNLPGLYQGLLAPTSFQAGWQGGFKDWNMAGQAATTLPNANLPPGLLICGFLSLYIVLIGPLNYFLLRKLRKKELSWASIPATAILFSAAVFFAGSSLRGGVPILSRLSIVLVPSNSNQASVYGLVGVYAPSRGVYTLQDGQGFLAHPLPGSSLVGGYNDWTFTQTGSGLTIPGLQVDVGGFRSFSLEGAILAPRVNRELSIRLASGSAQLEGQVTNPLQMALHNAILLSPGNTLTFGDLQPGEARPVNISLQKAQRSANGIKSGPFFAMPPGSSGPPMTSSIFSPSAPDSTIQDILGTANYYENRETFRRYALLMAAMSNNGGYSGRGGGVYLCGWVDGSPLDLSLPGRGYSSQDVTLYIIDLTPDPGQASGVLLLPPGLFSWNLLSMTQYSDFSLYNFVLYPGTYTLEYSLAYPYAYTKPTSLTLHLTSPGANGPSHIDVGLWDFVGNQWVRHSNISWGDTQIDGVDNFVAPGGLIRVQIQNSGSAGIVQIDRFDFTLGVEQ